MQTETQNSILLAVEVAAKPKVRGFVTISESQRLLEDAQRSGIEKLQLFTKMLRRDAMFKAGGIITKPRYFSLYGCNG